MVAEPRCRTTRFDRGKTAARLLEEDPGIPDDTDFGAVVLKFTGSLDGTKLWSGGSEATGIRRHKTLERGFWSYGNLKRYSFGTAVLEL